MARQFKAPLAEQMAQLQQRMERRDDRRNTQKGKRRKGSDDEWEQDQKRAFVSQKRSQDSVTEKDAAAAAVRAAAAAGGAPEKVWCDICNFECTVPEMRVHKEGPVHRKNLERLAKERELALRGGAGSVAMQQAGWGGNDGRTAASRAAAYAAETSVNPDEDAEAVTELVGSSTAGVGSRGGPAALARLPPPKAKPPKKKKPDPFAHKQLSNAPMPIGDDWAPPALAFGGGGEDGSEGDDEASGSESEGDRAGEGRETIAGAAAAAAGGGAGSTAVASVGAGGLVAYGSDSENEDSESDGGPPAALF